jgi:hypothetical protein
MTLAPTGRACASKRYGVIRSSMCRKSLWRLRSDDAVDSEVNRWRAHAVCLLGGFIVLLEVSIVNIALPSIRTGLQATRNPAQRSGRR